MSTWQNVFCCPAFYLYLCIRHSSACMRMTADGRTGSVGKSGNGDVFPGFLENASAFLSKRPVVSGKTSKRFFRGGWTYKIL